VLRATLDAERLGLLTVAASVAVAEAVDAFVSPHRAALKWPNDVLLEGRKTCGMLLESSFSSRQEAEIVILGVGLNVNQTTFPDELADTATSLRLITGRTVPRTSLFARLLTCLEARYDAVLAGKDAPVRDAFHNRLVHRGDTVSFRVPDTGDTISGVIRGITETGALRLDTADGPQILHAGDVTTRRDA
jgi:BirA family biotin operon repressor/biotin-[acetyl-CoA-carboxylase] ligase